VININLLPHLNRRTIKLSSAQMNDLMFFRKAIRSHLQLKELTYNNKCFIIKSNIIKIEVE